MLNITQNYKKYSKYLKMPENLDIAKKTAQKCLNAQNHSKPLKIV